MNPREYDMTTRAAAAEETRLRILEATLELHTERGIFGTSWQDIAGRADVSVGTVYRHFPSLSELVPACGELLMERTQPPAPEDAAEAIGDVLDPVVRLERAAAALFAFYERAGASLDSDPRERALPAMQEWEEYWRATVTAFVHEALRGRRVGAHTLQLVSAFFDHPTYGALRTRGIGPERAAETVSRMVACLLGLAGATGGRQIPAGRRR